jgi:transglutaminase-like putative cysteine protease
VSAVHPSRLGDLLHRDSVQAEPWVPVEEYRDPFGNRCTRLLAPAGRLRLWGDTVVLDSGQPDPVRPAAPQVPIQELPTEVLPFLLASRYCEVDLLSDLAWKLFGDAPQGWGRVKAVVDWVNAHVSFDYAHARNTRTAAEVLEERVGVCRDFQHLSVTFCRALGIPARYVTGYLGDIGVPADPAPMDFSAWFEAYLGGRWYAFDGRHNHPRIGRVLMAVGRDAADVAISTSFGSAPLKRFRVWTEEVKDPVLGPIPDGAWALNVEQEQLLAAA